MGLLLSVGIRYMPTTVSKCVELARLGARRGIKANHLLGAEVYYFVDRKQSKLIYGTDASVEFCNCILKVGINWN